MYTNNRDAYRQTFFAAWQKYQKQLPLEPVEKQLIEIMLLHPEYHPLLNHPEAFEKQEFELEENPFFHMSLHLAIREQIRTDRPAGITAVYDALSARSEDAEHLMMTCLAQMIWAAQQSGEMPSEEEYLSRLRGL